MKSLYLKNIDSLRFFAAALVVLDHSGLFKQNANAGLSNKLWVLFSGAGGMGVKMFFVLSGFLIFYLFKIEKRETKQINLKNFYIRRLLRIWPLYLLLGIVGTAVGPFILNSINIASDLNYIPENLLFVFLFAVNIQIIFFSYNSGIVEILWTIGVEEHFYLLMPLLLKWAKNFFYPILGLFIFGLLSPFILDVIFPQVNPKTLHYYFTTNSFSLFGIGAIAGHIYYYRDNMKKIMVIITNKYFQVFTLFVTIILSLSLIDFGPYFYNHFLNPFAGLVYAVFILQMVSENSILNLEQPMLKYLGKISFGIYLFHPFVAKIFLFVFGKFLANNFFNYEILFPLVVLLVTCILSYFSYEFFEKKFLTLKHKFSAVKTRI